MSMLGTGEELKKCVQFYWNCYYLPISKVCYKCVHRFLKLNLSCTADVESRGKSLFSSCIAICQAALYMTRSKVSYFTLSLCNSDGEHRCSSHLWSRNELSFPRIKEY